MLALADICNTLSRSVTEFYGNLSNGDYLNFSSLHLVGAAIILTVGTTYWWLNNNKKIVKDHVNLKAQTKILPNGSRICPCAEKIVDSPFEIHTLYDAILRGLHVSNNGPMLGYRRNQIDGSRPYVWMSYQEVIDAADNLAFGFSCIGIKPGQGTFIAISSKNRPEWVISQFATYRLGAIVVPLYDTLGPEAQIFMLNETQTLTVICDTEKRAIDFMNRKSSCPNLKYIVVMELFNKESLPVASGYDIKIYTFDDLLKMGQLMPKKPNLHIPKPEDISTICYTSGTTGRPKGAVLTHRNVIAATTTHHLFVNVSSSPKDTYMSYLPLAHMYEYVTECAVYETGASIGFYSGDVLQLLDDAVLLKPTIFPLVPRILNRIYDKVIATAKKSFISWIVFSIAVAYKINLLKRGIMRNDTFFDVIFKGLRKQFGGNVRIMLIGSAPTDGGVLTFARAAMGVPILEGYGQTECSGVCSCTLETDYTTGHIGVPLTCCTVKLVDVPELNYYVKDGAGELCIRGYNVFQGYFKNEKLTRETLDAEGWLHTGDIARWNENGCIQLIERKKNIFKLQQGEYIAPEKIESIYAKSELIAQSFVYGESLKTCLIGIVVPDKAALTKSAAELLSLTQLTFEELCALPSVKKLILEVLVQVGKKAGLQSFEQVHDIFVTPEPFSLENDLLTPTMKNKRPQLKHYFQSKLDEMYSKLK